jgi:uncharacterized protein YjbJ (UPF0337 family)
MNEDELKGGVRYTVGKVEKTIGDTVESRDWQVDGVVDQVAGGAQHGYGRARSIVEDVVDAAPELAEAARDHVKASASRVADAAQHGGKVAIDTVRDTPVLWGIAAAMGGYALAWLVHGRHDK